MACKHESARKVIAGAPMKWCSHCGLFFDGTRWHRTSTSGASARPKRAAAKRAPAKHKKARSPAQKAATARMLAARANRGHAR